MIDENNPEVRWVGAVQLSTDGPVSAFVEKPSRCQHLLRVVANVLRFVNNTRSKTSRKTDEFTAAEIQDSRSSVIRIAQRAAFGEEIDVLERGREIPNSSQIIRLNLKLTPEKEPFGARQHRMGLKIPANPSQRDQHYRITRPRISRRIRALVNRPHSTRIEKIVLDSAWQANRQEDRQEI